jgi:hypothetical protein
MIHSSYYEDALRDFGGGLSGTLTDKLESQSARTYGKRVVAVLP